jgi:hypothetical protein
MLKNKLIALVTSCGLLSGCGGHIHLQISSTKLPQTPPPAPREIVISPVKLQVVNKQNIQTFDAQVKNDGTMLVMTPHDYTNLLSNLAETGRYIQEQNAVIDYYQELNTDSEKPDAK